MMTYSAKTGDTTFDSTPAEIENDFNNELQHLVCASESGNAEDVECAANALRKLYGVAQSTIIHMVRST